MIKRLLTAVTAPATTPRVSREAPAAIPRDRWPSLKDPRYPFAAILTIYGVLGFTVFGFNRTPTQMFLIVASGMALEVALARVLRARWIIPLSAYISCCSLALLLNYSHHNWLLFAPVFLAIGSKYFLTFKQRHVFNPSLFGVAVSLLLMGNLITTAPAYQWAGGDVTLTAFIIMAALVLFVFKIGKNWLVVSFLIFYALQTALRAWIMRHHIPPEMLFLGTITAPAFFIFTFYMITDPATSPKTPRGQVLYALGLTLLDLYLHKFESVFTFLYAALMIAGGKLVWLHARELWRRRSALPDYWRALTRWPILKPRLVVGSLGLVCFSAYAYYNSKPVVRAGFTTTEIPASHSGLQTHMGDVLTQVDGRLLHVSKWILSVGDAVAVSDVNNDGLMDIFLTRTLHGDGERAALYLNQGDFRFERAPMPALERFQHSYAEHGMPGGATFVDWDGDGDQDLALAVGFGPSLLLRNELVESGHLAFTDVTHAMGLGAHHVSLAISFFDFNQDAHLDLFVANALMTHLDDYDAPTPLNIFALPRPQYDGDRRALRFMHNGWHDADNGGVNELYLGTDAGAFERLDLGMNETRWSLSVCTLDVNHDGWTDLYVANDFGPDRLYINRHGEDMVSIISDRYGDVGKDTYKGMNCSAADFDHNGYEDIYVSNVHHPLQAEGSLLWMVEAPENGVPVMRDQATQRDALNETRFGWGAATGDLNNDGWTDIVQANGMVGDRMDPRGYHRKDYWYVNHKLMQSGPEHHTYADMWGDIRGRVIFPNEARRVYLNLGEEAPGYFGDVADQIGVDDPDNSRGVAMVDLDNDGDLDLLITNQHGPSSLYKNNLREPGQKNNAAHFIGLTLRGDGVKTHRAAIGSRVRVRSRDKDGGVVEQSSEVRLLTGFSAQGDPRLHFGLGEHQGPVEVTILWYGAQTQTITLDPDRYHEVAQP